MSARPDGVRFTVLGEAKPAGSKRAFTNPKTGRPIVTDSSGRGGRAWRQDVKSAASEAMGDRELLTGPLAVVFTFVRERPKGHYGKGRNADRLVPSAPPYPTTRPDLLKLARAVEDALSGVVYRDDSQIVEEFLLKRWGDRSRVEVAVDLMRDPAADLPSARVGSLA